MGGEAVAQDASSPATDSTANRFILMSRSFPCGSCAAGRPLWRRPAALPPDLSRRCRSEEHTSELQSLMRTSYAVFCLKKQNTTDQPQPIQSADTRHHTP